MKTYSVSTARSLALAEMEIRARRNRERFSSLHDFLRGCWHALRPTEKFIDGWHIRALCWHLEAVSDGRLFECQEADTLLVNIPPGHMKSMLCCVVWPAWHWSTRPEAKFLFASYSGKFAIRDSIARRNLIQSDWYQRHWRLPLAEAENAAGKFANVYGGSMAATSPGGVGTGEHPHFIVADDPLSAKEAESLASREAVIRWWSSTVTSRGVIHDSRKVVIAQRLHRNDLPGYILANSSPVVICLPLEYEGPHRMTPTPLGWRDERKEIGQVLWPEAFTPARVAKLKRMAPRDAAGQLQQSPPAQSTGSEFPSTYFGESIWFQEWPAAAEIVAKVMYLDPSLGKTDKADYSAFVMLSRDDNGGLWVDANIERRDVSSICDESFELFNRFGPQAFGVESNGFQVLLQPVLEARSQRSGIHLPLYTVTNSAPKLVRVRSLSWRLKEGRIRFRDTPGCRELVAQLREYPDHPYDDGPDALAGACELLDKIWGEQTGAVGTEDEDVTEERVWG